VLDDKFMEALRRVEDLPFNPKMEAQLILSVRHSFDDPEFRKLMAMSYEDLAEYFIKKAEL